MQEPKGGRRDGEREGNSRIQGRVHVFGGCGCGVGGFEGMRTMNKSISSAFTSTDNS